MTKIEEYEQTLYDTVGEVESAISNLCSLMGAYHFDSTPEGKRKLWSEMLNQIERAKKIKSVDALIDSLI